MTKYQYLNEKAGHAMASLILAKKKETQEHYIEQVLKNQLTSIESEEKWK